jgi:protein-S-isoprenylcysteine O-methyltransferase Ste14
MKILVIAIIVFVVAQIATNISNKISSNQFGIRLAFFQAQYMNIVYVILGLIIMIPMQLTNNIAPEEVKCTCGSKRFWIYLGTGILDSFTVFFIAVGSTYTPGPWQTLLLQLPIPITFIMAPIFLQRTRDMIKINKHMFFAEIVGIFFILLGIFVSITPDILKGDADYKWYSVAIFAVSGIPSSVSFILKENALQDDKGSAVHLNVWNAIWMVPFTFALLPLQTIPWFGGIPINELPLALTDGCKCFIGMNITGASCDLAWIPENIFSLGTFLAGCAAVVMTKVASAEFQWIAGASVLPLTNIIYALPLMPPSIFSPFDIYGIAGLLIVSIGFVIYWVAEHRMLRDYNRYKMYMWKLN